MTYTAQPPVKRPATRLVAGWLWLVAAGLAVGATFPDILHRTYPGATLTSGFWRQGTDTDSQEPVVQTVYYGISVVIAAVLLVLAFLVAVLTVRRWAAVVAGAFGTGMLLDASATWYVELMPKNELEIRIQLGLFLLSGALLIALAALVVSLVERARPARRPMFAPPPPMPPQHMRPPQQQPVQPPTPPSGQRLGPPRIEPETPKYGIPAQPQTAQPQTAQPPTAQPPTAQVQPARPDTGQQPESPLENPQPTSSIEPPPPPPPGSIARKLDGDEK